MKAKPVLGKDPVSDLMEYCRAISSPPPVFAFEQTGPPHMLTVVCSCTCQGVTKTETARKKQDAKKLAARSVLAVLPQIRIRSHK